MVPRWREDRLKGTICKSIKINWQCSRGTYSPIEPDVTPGAPEEAFPGLGAFFGVRRGNGRRPVSAQESSGCPYGPQ
jgi:hypothetical protein